MMRFNLVITVLSPVPSEVEADESRRQRQVKAATVTTKPAPKPSSLSSECKQPAA